MTTTSISVVIATHERPALVDRCIASTARAAATSIVWSRRIVSPIKWEAVAIPQRIRTTSATSSARKYANAAS